MVAAEDPIQDDVVDDAAEQPDESSNVIDFEQATRDGDEGEGDDGGENQGGVAKRLIALKVPAAAALRAVRTRAPSALRPLAITGVVVLILVWTVIAWRIGDSVAVLGEAARTIAAEQTAVTAAVPAAPAVAVAVAGAGDGEGPTVRESGAIAAALRMAAVGQPPINVVWTEPPPLELVPPPPRMLFGILVKTDGKDVWDCSDFETWEQAKMVYDANLPEDPNILDFFVTGVPCQYLYFETAE